MLRGFFGKSRVFSSDRPCPVISDGDNNSKDENNDEKSSPFARVFASHKRPALSPCSFFVNSHFLRLHAFVRNTARCFYSILALAIIFPKQEVKNHDTAIHLSEPGSRGALSAIIVSFLSGHYLGDRAPIVFFTSLFLPTYYIASVRHIFLS